MKEYYISSTKYSLSERQTKRGKVYDVVFRIVTLDGFEKQKKLSGFQTKSLAKQAYTEFVTENCTLVKNNPLKKKDSQKVECTIEELVRQYLLSLGNQNKESTIYDKIKIFEKFIIPTIGSKKISAVNTAELYKWQDELWCLKNEKTGEFFSYNYLDKIRSHFSSFWAWNCSRNGTPNAFLSVKKPKRRTPKTEMKFWTTEEFENFIAVVDDKKYHCLFTLMFYTGRRKGELLALSPNDIKTDSIVISKSVTRKTLDGSTYKVTSTKADKKQEIPLCAKAIAELQAYNGESPFFFGCKRPIPENTLTRAFQKYVSIANVKKIRIHDLRHSYVSLLIHLGANFMVIAELIGDTVDQVVKTYGHLYASDKKEIVSKIK